MCQTNFWRKGTAIILFLMAAVLVNAENTGEKEKIITVVNQFFEVIETRDAGLADKILIPGGISFSIREKEGGPLLRKSGFKGIIDSLAQSKAQYKETMQNPKVLIHKRIAVLWADYKFYVDGKFSHCGVDAFNLIKTKDRWQIASIIYTVEKTGCR